MDSKVRSHSMMKSLNTPAIRFAFVLGFGFLVAVLATHMALEHPKWSQPFEAGMTLTSNKGTMIIEPIDLLLEPGEIEDHEQFNTFFDRQGQFADVLSTGSVAVASPKGVTQVTAAERGIREIPILFWIQLFVGLGSLAISGWIWSLRSRDWATGLFAISGLSMVMSAVSSALYTTRELALPKILFQCLEALNAAGASLFGISILAMFLIYPLRLPKWRLIAGAQAIFFMTWLSLYFWQLTPPWAGISLIIVSEMLAICVVIAAQFFATKKNPTARASLTWLGLSVVLGAGAFVGFNTLPLVLGLPSLNQGYAFLFFLIIYVGLAAGLTRYRLFEVGQWAFRFLFYATGAVVLVLLDAALVFGLEVDRVPALGVALLVAGFLYLPLRDVIWRYFSRRGRMETHELLQKALHVAFAPSAVERTARWESLLRGLFDPLELTPLTTNVSHVEILSDGLTLLMPPVAGAPALKLVYPWSGQSLYSPQSLELARQLVTLIEQADLNRQSYDRGVREERRRMAQDLHDDVGARLLTGLHLADDKLRPTLQGAIADIRSIVSGMTDEQIELSRLVEDLRFEISRRLEATSIELDWPLVSFENSRLLDYRQRKAIVSALREIVSNVIRHSGATKLTVEFAETKSSLKVSCTDNGKGISEQTLMGEGTGFGLKSLRRRLSDAGGSFDLQSSSLGTCATLTFIDK